MAYVIPTKIDKKYWVKYIHQRIRQNKNALLFISGPTGSGKSWSSLSIAKQIDEDFTIDRVVFSAEELMMLINSDGLKKGSVIVFEEVGVELNNKNWASTTNKLINYLMQTFRHRCFVLIMNSPFMDFVDSSTRKLFHGELQTIGINHSEGWCKLKPQLIQYNGRYSKFYYKYLRVKTSRGYAPVTSWKITAPPKDLLEDYEVRKRRYTDELNDDILRQLREAKIKKEGGNRVQCMKCEHKWRPRIPKAEITECPKCRKYPDLV